MIEDTALVQSVREYIRNNPNAKASDVVLYFATNKEKVIRILHEIYG